MAAEHVTNFSKCPCGTDDPLSVEVQRCIAPQQLRGDLYLVYCKWCGRGTPFVTVHYRDSVIPEACATWNAAIAALSAGGEVVASIRAAVAELRPPEHITQARAEYWKAGARATVNAVNQALAKAPTSAGAVDAVDAARYRWFRSHAQGEAWNEHDYALVGIEIHKQRGTCKFDMTPEIIDEAIDAAIDACRKGEGL